MFRDPWKELAQKDGRRRRDRSWRKVLATGAAVLLGASVIGGLTATLAGLSAADPADHQVPSAAQQEVQALRLELDDVRGQLALAEVRLEHVNAVAKYSELYNVPAHLAAAIYDIALSEGIHPSLGFQLVKVESGFRPTARSVKGAIGYTQLRLKTARIYDSTVTERELEERDLNLRLGFRFLKDLLARFDQDLQMALLAYNRGPTRVTDMLARGEDPRNGYSEAVMKGVRRGS